MRFNVAVTLPGLLYGSLAPSRWTVPWLARWDVARHAGRMSRQLRDKHAGRDIWLCHACGATRSWRSVAGMNEREEDPNFDLRAFLG